MKNKKRVGIAAQFALFGLLTLELLAQNLHVLTLDRSIEYALKNSPTIAIGKYDFEAALQRSKFQEGNYLPRFDAGASAGRTGVKFSGGQNLSGNALVASLNASQLLYDFGKTQGLVDASISEREAFRANLNQNISFKILDIKTKYYDALKDISIIEVNKKNIELQELQLKRAQRFNESGIKTIIDVTDARVRLLEAKLDLSNAEYSLKNKRALLEESMGYVPNGGNYKLVGGTLDVNYTSVTLPEIKESMAALENFAYAHRFELDQTRAFLASTKGVVKNREAQYYPTLNATGDYTAQNVESELESLTPEKQWHAGVGLRWNLYSGGQRDASLEEAKVASLRASASLDAMQLRVKREVVEAVLFVRRMKDAVLLSQNILKASEERFYQAQKRYENELSDYIEFQQAQQGYIGSLGNLVASYYDYYISIARLDYAVGR